MWYNALIPLGIIVVLTTLPAYVSPYINKFIAGNKSGRLFNSSVIEQMAYLRDFEHGGKKNWKFNGLEVIPDK